jgi:photosystem II stability/assembly factor-like uncharacterized protein
MADRILVGTRKGLFDLAREGAAWRIARTSFLGDPVSAVLHDPADGSLLAALALGHFGVKLRRSRDGGASWADVAAPALPPAKGDAAAPAVSLLWCLERDAAGRLWCGTIPGALFRSDDGGDSWALVEPLWTMPERAEWTGGGYDHAGIHTVLSDPRAPDRLVIGVSTGGVWLSDDAGASWRLGGHGLVAEYMPPERRLDPRVQDVHRIVQCPARPDTLWTQHHNGVFRSDDRGATWREITAVRPAKFGFAVAVHPADPETAWFVPGVKDECRVPVGGALAVARTHDGGLSFVELRRGLPQRDAFDLVYRHALDVDGRGRSLAMGSTTGNLWTSDDGGESWLHAFGHLPPVACVRFAA